MLNSIIRFALRQPLVVLGLALVVIVAGFWIAKHFFSDEARWERRRRRSNAPITSKHNRPSVRFSVNLKKRKKP